MAPPSTKPKLTHLTPEIVAYEVAKTTVEHASNLIVALLSPAYDHLHASQSRRSPNELCCETQVYMTVLDLSAYAINGAALDAPVQEYLVSLLPLWSSAAGECPDIDGLVGDVDPATQLGLVICAASAREKLAAGQSVSAAQLAVLSGLSATQVRLLARNGELELSDGEIAAKAARRWLAVRGVSGFPRKGTK
jgi:hypothetical protein